MSMATRPLSASRCDGSSASARSYAARAFASVASGDEELRGERLHSRLVGPLTEQRIHGRFGTWTVFGTYHQRADQHQARLERIRIAGGRLRGAIDGAVELVAAQVQLGHRQLRVDVVGVHRKQLRPRTARLLQIATGGQGPAQPIHRKTRPRIGRHGGARARQRFFVPLLVDHQPRLHYQRLDVARVASQHVAEQAEGLLPISAAVLDERDAACGGRKGRLFYGQRAQDLEALVLPVVARVEISENQVRAVVFQLVGDVFVASLRAQRLLDVEEE